AAIVDRTLLLEAHGAEASNAWQHPCRRLWRQARTICRIRLCCARSQRRAHKEWRDCTGCRRGRRRPSCGTIVRPPHNPACRRCLRRKAPQACAWPWHALVRRGEIEAGASWTHRSGIAVTGIPEEVARHSLELANGEAHLPHALTEHFFHHASRGD